MTDKEFNALKKKVERIAHYWRDILDLNGHRLRYKFIRERHTDRFTIAECSSLWQYKSHTITFYMPSVAECDDDTELEEDILHELVHILIAPASGNDAPKDEHLREKVEFATQSVTYALIYARKAGRKDSSKHNN